MGYKSIVQIGSSGIDKIIMVVSQYVSTGRGVKIKNGVSIRVSEVITFTLLIVDKSMAKNLFLVELSFSDCFHMLWSWEGGGNIDRIWIMLVLVTEELFKMHKSEKDAILTGED